MTYTEHTSHKRRARQLLLALIACSASVSLAVVGCGDKESESSSAGSSGQGGGEAGSFSTDSDLIALAHLADVDQGGLFIDFGTPAQAKYTVGDWRSGYGSRGSDGDTTYANVGQRARIYFPMEQAETRHVRLHLRARGTGALTPYINNEQLEAIFFEGDAWQDLNIELPAAHTRAGENYLLLAFGGTTDIGGEAVSVQLGSAWIAKTADFSATAPEWGTYVANVSLGEDARQALVQRGESAMSWHLEVPPSGSFSFAVGQEGEAGGSARVIVQAEGGEPSEVHQVTTTGAWQSARVNLSEYAGQIIKLTLASSGGQGRVAWAAPKVEYPAQAAPELEPAQNVVVLLIDTLRASKLKAWNPDSRVRTPALDSLAESSVLFENAQATENWTKPNVGAILTGLYPLDHGARTQEAVLSNSVTMISEHFQSNGFATGGFIANGYISDAYGFAQGWDRYKNFIRERGASSEAEDVFKEAGDWALEHRDERFFLYVHTIDPHVPYDPEQEFVSMYDARTDYDGQVRPRMTGELLEQAKGNNPSVVFTASDQRRLEALHDGEITQHDLHMGRFIERLREADLWDNTVFVVVSDHGEEFNEHGSWGHGHSIYQELLHVPFMIHRTGIDARRVATTVSTVDLPATVIEMAGLPALEGTSSRSVVPLLYGQHRPGPSVAMSDFLDERRVALAGRWKFFIRGNLREDMFDLESDPGENHQLNANEHPIAARYLRVMQGQFLGASDRARWLDAEQGQGQRFEAGQVEMTDELQAQLRELGYMN